MKAFPLEDYPALHSAAVDFHQSGFGWLDPCNF